MSVNFAKEKDYDEWNFFYQDTLQSFFNLKGYENINDVKTYLNKLRNPTKSLWGAYQNQTVEVDYGNLYIQESYFFRYCPIYSSIIFEVLDKIKNNYRLENNSEYLEYSFISAGPGSEALGFFNWICKNFPSELETYTEITLYDKYNWGIPREAIIKALSKKLNNFEGNRINSIYKDVFSFSNDLEGTNQKIILFQNCLNEILVEKDSESKFLNILLKISKSLIPGGMMIFIDRAKYKRTHSFLDATEEKFKEKSLIQIFNQDELKYINRWKLNKTEIPEILKNNVFTGESGLIASQGYDVICKVFQKK